MCRRHYDHIQPFSLSYAMIRTILLNKGSRVSVDKNGHLHHSRQLSPIETSVVFVITVVGNTPCNDRMVEPRCSQNYYGMDARV